MGNVFVEETTLRSIANAVRGKTGRSGAMLPAQMPAEIQSIATADGIDYDTFWDKFQGVNGRISYHYAFSYDRFNDATYNPKYPIVCSTGSATAQSMFYTAKSITDTKVLIDVTNLTGSAALTNTFANASSLVTIRELKVQAANTYPGTFNGCNSLKNITITGTIGNDISFVNSPLTPESVQSIIDALADLTGQTQKTLTLKSTVLAALTDAQKDTIASKNWKVQ